MKEKILEYLKNNPKIAQTKIATTLGINYYTFLKIIEEMEKDSLVIKHEETNATYWSVK